MAEIVFHHVQGLTDGVQAFADIVGRAGHVVHTPDLYEGKDGLYTELVVFYPYEDAEVHRRFNEGNRQPSH